MKIIFYSTIHFLFLSSLALAIAAIPNKQEASETPVTLEDLFGSKVLTESREWRPPIYQNQGKALGYSELAFQTPKGMESQVQFWIDIYSKYTTEQGVIHDSEYIDLVYSVVSFAEINKDASLNSFQKEKMKQKKVDQEKERIIEMLKRFSTFKSAQQVPASEMDIWKYFSAINEPNKFIEATQKNRIRFQLGQKDRMQQAIFLSGRYIEDMEVIFSKQNLPKELVRLVFVESSFNILARSKVGASGLWQIMPYTAKPYRMISPAVDKRNHPLEATQLAAKLLASNYRMLESWPLAVTGYNHGPAGVRKMTQKYQTRDLADLVKNVRSRKSFGFASRNFYASFLAALEVEKNAAKYFDKVFWSQKLPAKEVKLPVAISYNDLLLWFSKDETKTQVYNPHLTYQVREKNTLIPIGATLQVPSYKYDEVLVALAQKSRRVANSKDGKK